MQRQLEQRMGEMTQVVIARTGELQQAHDDSEQLLNAISSLLIEVDSELRVRRWNQRAETMFSISVAEAMGVRFADLPISWVDAAQAETLVNRETSNGDTHVEIAFRDANEMHRVIGVSTHQIEAHGVVQGSLLLGVDLTDQRSLERQLQLQAGQKLEAIGQLAAGVAHEINTPLQYVGDNLQYLKSSFEKVLAPLEVCLRLLSSEQDDIVLGDVMSELSGSMQSRKHPLANNRT
jgi:two-component system NtrC family sensor kinase